MDGPGVQAMTGPPLRPVPPRVVPFYSDRSYADSPDVDYCYPCMYYARKAAWLATRWPNRFGEKWMEYACQRFLQSFTHTAEQCHDRVIF